METENIFEEVLIKPGKDFQELFIVSGYASASFLNKHLKELKKKYKTNNHKISLIIGMPGRRADHLGYLSIDSYFPSQFSGFYLDHSQHAQCHAKVYVWSNDKDCAGYSGSANYSQAGFNDSIQINQMTLDDGIKIKQFFDQLKSKSIPMENYEFSIENEHDVFTPYGHVKGGKSIRLDEKTYKISFLSQKGDLPKISGINWGQRPERNKNQAYLPLRGEERSPGFLPPKKKTFTMITDDNKSFDCVVAQQGSTKDPRIPKAIHTTHDNSLMGSYLRERIGVNSESLVTKDDLLTYGRTDFVIRILDEETVYFDFSVN